jgi:hypothetical protein
VTRQWANMSARGQRGRVVFTAAAQQIVRVDGTAPVLTLTGGRRSAQAAWLDLPSHRPAGRRARRGSGGGLGEGDPAAGGCTAAAHLIQAAHQQLGGLVALVWDNLNTHLTAWMRRCLTQRDRFTGCRLPPCAPDLNPTEGNWSVLRRTALANRALRRFGGSDPRCPPGLTPAPVPPRCSRRLPRRERTRPRTTMTTSRIQRRRAVRCHRQDGSPAGSAVSGRRPHAPLCSMIEKISETFGNAGP